MSSEQLNRGRRSVPGQVYVLSTTCHARQRRFLIKASADCVINQFHEMQTQGRVCSLAWVVMPDHIHWMLELKSGTLPHLARRVKSSSALALNRMSGNVGRVWQAGYFDHAMRDDESLERQAKYILANPVRAGLACAIGEYPFAWCVWGVD